MENQEQGKENYKHATVRANMSAMKGHLISLRLSVLQYRANMDTKPVLWFSLLKRGTQVGLFATLEIGLRHVL